MERVVEWFSSSQVATLDTGWIDVSRSIRWEFLKTFCWNCNSYCIFLFFRYIIDQCIIHLKLRRFRRASRNRDRRIITCKSIISTFIIVFVILIIIMNISINDIIKWQSPAKASSTSSSFDITIVFIILIIVMNISIIKWSSPAKALSSSSSISFSSSSL